jgi:hypothetical protein
LAGCSIIPICEPIIEPGNESERVSPLPAVRAEVVSQKHKYPDVSGIAQTPASTPLARNVLKTAES